MTRLLVPSQLATGPTRDLTADTRLAVRHDRLCELLMRRAPETSAGRRLAHGEGACLFVEHELRSRTGVVVDGRDALDSGARIEHARDWTTPRERFACLCGVDGALCASCAQCIDSKLAGCEQSASTDLAGERLWPGDEP